MYTRFRDFKHEYLRSRAYMYMFVIFIIIIRVPFYQIMDYRDTRANIFDPCIQVFFARFFVHNRVRKFTLTQFDKNFVKATFN